MEHLNNYIQFILESKATINLFYSEKFRDILYSLKDSGSENTKNIANNLISSENNDDIKDEYSLVDISDKNDKITLIQVNRIKHKYPNMTDEDIISVRKPDSNFWSTSRIEFKLGKWVQRIYVNVQKSTITNSSIEEFVNSYKAHFDKNSNKIIEVSGDDIKKYYLEDNYYEKSGQLGNSCMRYKKCQDFFDIYMYNTDVCKLLVMLDNDKVKGRALLWTKTDGTKYMDRIYTSYDSDKKIFEEYADKHNYDKYPAKTTFKVKISDDEYGVSFNKYPYMDTLVSYNPDTGFLTNSLLDDDDWIVLQSTNGQHSGNEGTWSEYLGEYINEEDAVWCENINSYVHCDSAIWLEYIGEYAFDGDDIVYSDYYDGAFYKDDVVWSKIGKDWYYLNNGNFYEVILNSKGDTDYVPKESTELYIYDNGKYYYKINYIKDPYTYEYHFYDEIIEDKDYKDYLIGKLEDDLGTHDINIIKEELINIYNNNDYDVDKITEFIENDREFKSKKRIYNPVLNTKDIILILFSQMINYYDPTYIYNPSQRNGELLQKLEKFDINEDFRKRYSANNGNMINYILLTFYNNFDLTLFGDNVYKRYLYLEIKRN